ncbi:uncharacterized protein LOC8037360 isoform X2 [Ixodes scapularis]|uniref:uncharacterized protein LOC8037360 isoform X2 n=1 Tax=Ixodes scapularis TaxID=6945 RepID=UPI001A9ED032|nr:uncharacterized protein LOC8037360 isoform X2 [Ixodes scapularis]
MLEGTADIATSQLEHAGRLAPQPTQEPLDLVRNSTHEDASEVHDARLESQQVLPKTRRGRGKAVPVSTPSQPCRFFANHGHCRYRDRCRYSHGDVGVVSDHLGAETPEAEDVAKQKKPSSGEPTEPNEVADPNAPLPTRAPAQSVLSPNFPGQDTPKRELTEDETLKELRAREIEQFHKRYRRCRKIAADEENGEKFSFVFQPTDPDWPFDVKELTLLVSFPRSYPKECFTLNVLDEEAVLPPVLLRDLNRAVASWLLEKHATNEKLGQTQLILRPFLRWFDRNLEDLFIEGLRKVKKMQLAEAAGLEFVPFEQLASKADDKPAKSTMGTDVLNTETEDARSVEPSVRDDLTQNVEAEERTEVDFNGVWRSPSEANPIQVGDDSVELEKTRDHKTEAEVGDRELSNKKALESHKETESVEKRDGAAKSEQPDAQKPRADILVNQKRGTEIKFRRLELGENVATLECLKVALRIQCSRCRCNADLTTPPRRRNVVACGRCSHSGTLTFRPNLMHAFNSVVGYLDLTDYQVVDLVLSGCTFALECFGCNKRISTDGIHYGQRRSLWCQFCNAKMAVLMESIKFQQLQPSKAAEGGPCFSVKTPKAVKNVKDPAIQEGKPLPSNGICKHYKKSFRWLRFPCCGKAYPCDKCHDEQEGGHEMKFATRMICGHCAKEQPFAAEKPCIGCGSFTTKKPTAHWEGGRGCRDSIKMSRDDNKKYSGIGKTISRKAQDKVSGKK